jgi:hypothetical protein
MPGTNREVIWSEVGPCEHFVQFYEDDEVLMDTLEGFIGPGLVAGDGAIVIATETHLHGLNQRLKKRGLNLAEIIAQDQYVPLDAAQTLARFMNNGWPDQARFLEVVHAIIGRVARGNRRIRAFGEMVAMLWAEGNRPATIRLEQLWNVLGKSEAFSLFCAYPKHAFNAEGCHGSLIDICASHSRVISATGEFESLNHPAHSTHSACKQAMR